MSARIRQIVEADRADWVRMRDALWPGSLSDHEAETLKHFAVPQPTMLVFVAEADGRSVGFLELGYRPYAEGCQSSPVPFIEGWFVDPAFQTRGIGRALVEAAEESARADGYTEMASDVLIDNDVSIAAHGALGYEEVERLACFRKSLIGGSARREGHRNGKQALPASLRTVIGYDPGGDGAHGLAVLRFQGSTVIEVTTRTLPTADAVLSEIGLTDNLAAIGIDSLTCWSTGRCGWRPADRWLRERFKDVSNSVTSPNSLYGSMCLNGMGVLIGARQKFRQLPVTETHPKVLYRHLAQTKYAYATAKPQMDAFLASTLGATISVANEHEWDAAISAFAALCGINGAWKRDLHLLPTAAGEQLIKPCGETQYFWPDASHQ